MSGASLGCKFSVVFFFAALLASFVLFLSLSLSLPLVFARLCVASGIARCIMCVRVINEGSFFRLSLLDPAFDVCDRIARSKKL